MTDDQYERFVRMEMNVSQLKIDTTSQFTNLRNIETKVDTLLTTMEAGKISWKILATLGAMFLGMVAAAPWILSHIKFTP